MTGQILDAFDPAITMSAATSSALLIASAQAPLGSTLIAVALPSTGESTSVPTGYASGFAWTVSAVSRAR